MPNYKDSEKRNAYARAWYAAHPRTKAQKKRGLEATQKFYASTPGWWKHYYQRRRDWLDSFKEACKTCGYAACKNALVFHHRDGTKKLDGLAALISKNASKARLLAEMAKCDVLCANCHAATHCSRA